MSNCSKYSNNNYCINKSNNNSNKSNNFSNTII